MDISVHSVRTQYLSGPLALDADVGPILNGAETYVAVALWHVTTTVDMIHSLYHKLYHNITCAIDGKYSRTQSGIKDNTKT